MRKESCAKISSCEAKEKNHANWDQFLAAALDLATKLSLEGLVGVATEEAKTRPRAGLRTCPCRDATRTAAARASRSLRSFALASTSFCLSYHNLTCTGWTYFPVVGSAYISSSSNTPSFVQPSDRYSIVFRSTDVLI